MEWATSSSKHGPVGIPAGDIDDSACLSFLAHLRAGVATAAGDGGVFTIDLAAVDHVTARALMAMTQARKEALAQDVRIILARPTPLVREVLDISKYGLIFDIVDVLDGEG